MFSPIEVVPYLTHDDPIVADHARHYLQRMRHVAPVDGDAAWRAIDQVSEDRWNSLLRLLTVLPPTRDSLARQLEWGTSQRPAELRYTLLHGLLDLDMTTLAKHGEQILAAPLPPHLSRQLRARLELLDKPPAELMRMWRREIELANAAEDKLADLSRIDAIAEAAVLFEPSVVEEAVQIASDETIIDWREVFAVRMLGLAPHADGVRLLLEKLRQEDGDYLLEGAQDALIRLGTVEVVQAIAEVYSGEGWVFRLYAGASLERINLPECEAALLQLAEREESINIRTNLAAGLCAMGSRAGLALAIEMIKRQEYDRQVAELDDDVRGAAPMLGVEVPPLPPKRARTEALLAFLQSCRAADAATAAHWLECGEHPDRVGLIDEMERMRASDDEPPLDIETFVRDEPRIGRNEPCPCGSGRKYKKCCLRNEQAVNAL